MRQNNLLPQTKCGSSNSSNCCQRQHRHHNSNSSNSNDSCTNTNTKSHNNNHNRGSNTFFVLLATLLMMMLLMLTFAPQSVECGYLAYNTNNNNNNYETTLTSTNGGVRNDGYGYGNGYGATDNSNDDDDNDDVADADGGDVGGGYGIAPQAAASALVSHNNDNNNNNANNYNNDNKNKYIVDDGVAIMNGQKGSAHDKHQHQQQHEQHDQQQLKQPTVTVTTNIGTAATATATTPTATTTTPTATTAGTLNTAASGGMQPAYAYEAAIPLDKHILALTNGVAPTATATTTTMTTTTTGVNGETGTASAAYPQQQQQPSIVNDSEYDNDASKKIIDSSVATSVSVVLNENNDEPQFTDALGHPVPKPQPSLQVASPINLLNPDRYEFYTFDEHGELVKRLMTMQEIQSIVANGDGEGPSIIHVAPVTDRDPEKNVQEIVQSVQSVLHKQVESSKNASMPETLPVLDTPDVSSSWSMILPAIFGNSGSDIFPQHRPQQIVMTPDSELVETSTKAAPTPSATRATKKPKPNKRKPGQKRKPSTTSTTTTTEVTPQVVQEELGHDSVYTGMQQYQNIASNMQSFDGFAQLHMEPLYHKLPESTTKQEAQQPTPAYTSSTVSATSDDELGEEFGKKPHGVHNKPQLHKRPQPPPHRRKNPNGAQAVHPVHATTTTTTTTTTSSKPHNKQKVTKKPPTTTTPVPTTTTSTTTTTTTTTPEPTTTTSTTTTTSAPTVPTTPKQKNKKKKPTRKPAQPAIVEHEPHPSNPHKKPARPSTPQKPRPKPQHQRPTPPATQPPASTPPTTEEPPQSPPATPITGAHHKPKPGHHEITSEAPDTPHPQPVVQHDHLHNKYHGGQHDDQAAEPSAHKDAHPHKNRPQQHKKRPRPKPKPTTTSTTTTTTTTTVLPAEIPASTSETTLVVQDFPGYDEPPKKLIIGDTSNAATKRPATQGYPVPAYGLNQQSPPYIVEEQIEDQSDFNKLKKEPLPSLAMVQKQQQAQLQLQQNYGATLDVLSTEKPKDDLHTLASYDQIVQSLQDSNGEAAKDKTETTSTVTTKPHIIKHETSTVTQSVKQQDQKKTTVPLIIATTISPAMLSANYGGSTLATVLSDEDGMTGRPPVMTTTDTVSGETHTTASEENEQNQTPIVVITARPHFYATTKKPEEETTTNLPYIQHDIEHVEDEDTQTDLPGYTQQVETSTEQLKQQSVTTSTIPPSKKPTAATEEQSHVVKFEPLYAEVAEPIVTEISSTSAKPSTLYSDLNEDEESTTMQMSIELETHTEANVVTTTIDDEIEEAVYTTPQVARLPVKVSPQKVESMIAEGEESTEPLPLVADLKPNLNMDVLKPTEQITMSDFQTQAATVASTLVDGSNTVGADVFMNSNETKSEIEFLMSDVIQQITNQEVYRPSVDTIAHEQDDSNRLSNYAQLNSSFLLKPKPVKTETQQSIGGSGASYSPSLPTPIHIHSTTESIKLKLPAQQGTHKPMVATEVHIPSKEELIKQEEAYLNTMKLPSSTSSTTESPEVDEEETTTFKAPMPSLSEIYAQQQADEDKLQSQYAAEKEKDKQTPMVVEQTQVASQHTVSQDAVHATNEDEGEEDENEEEEDSSTTTETSTETIEYEKPSTETLQTDSKKDELSSSSESDAQDQKYAIMINASDSETETEKTSTVIEEETSTEASTTHDQNNEQKIDEESSTEQGYATMINKVEKETAAVASTASHDDQQKEEQTKEHEVTKTTAAQPQATSTVNSNYNITSNDDEATTESSEHDNKTTTTAEESTEKPGESTIYITDSDMELSSEQTTEKYIVNKEGTTAADEQQSEEELTAEISGEDEVEETIEEGDEEDEDPYVKLGENNAKPVDNKVVQQKLQPQQQQYEQAPMESAIKQQSPTSDAIVAQMGTTNEFQGTLPVMSYGQAPDADEEDEYDQTGYQHTKLQAASSSTTTTKATSTTTTSTSTTTAKPTSSTTKRMNTLKPVSYYKQPIKSQPEPSKPISYNANTSSQRPMQRPPQLNNLMATSTQATRPPVKLEPSPQNSKGLEASVRNLDEDILAFARLCNELAFSYWKSITSEKISSARSLVMSPFALTSMLSMVFLGARGGTSGEMNEVLKLDDMVTFNPHLVFKNITESVERSDDSEIATAAFVREIFSDRSNGKILQFFKEKTQQFYAGHVEEVNFHVVNDIIRRRTNLLVKRHTMGKVLEYLRTNSVWVNGPLATISANLFQTDCSRASTSERDGEMFFQVHPTVRQRRLVPIPAVLYKTGFTAGYEPQLDVTVVAFGRIQDEVSVVYVMPGHQSSVSPIDNLDRLEHDLVDQAFSKNAWSNILTSVMDRPGMEVQLPRFSHRSFVNASLGLQKMGLRGLFKSDFADLRGLTGSPNRDIFLSDMIQINTFSTCGEGRISDHHHVEMYPAPPLRKRNKDVNTLDDDDDTFNSSETIIDFGSLVQDSALGRGFYDDLLDPKYLELPLPLRPRQARVPDTPRLRFDKPFLYFVRHNPTGMILFMGRFNPRLLP